MPAVNTPIGPVGNRTLSPRADWIPSWARLPNLAKQAPDSRTQELNLSTGIVRDSRLARAALVAARRGQEHHAQLSATS